MKQHPESAADYLDESLRDRVLAHLGLAQHPAPTLDGLRALYDRWCRRVPFDNVRKLIHLRSGSPAPLPGATAADFFAGWLAHGTGGTCWPGAGALHALLVALGFTAERVVATMLVAPHLPPNHGSVRVLLDGTWFLLDSSMLHGEPLPLAADGQTGIAHPAWGVRCARLQDRWQVAWRPLHRPEGFACRLESFGASGASFREHYHQTRGWSPFNFELQVRLNRGDCVTGAGFGRALTLRQDGTLEQSPLTPAGRQRLLIEEIGLSEEIVSQLPPDQPTPPPPGSRTAQGAATIAPPSPSVEMTG